jgi:hypothetical protein
LKKVVLHDLYRGKSEKLPEANFSRQSRKKIANCDIGDRQRDPWLVKI